MRINAVYGKTMEDVRKHTEFDLVSAPERFQKCVNSPTYKARHVINENFVGVEKEKAVAGCQGGPWGIRASDLRAPSLNCLVVRSLDPSKSKIPHSKSKIRNPKSKVPSRTEAFLVRFWGFWILDFGPLCSNSFTKASR